MASATSGDPRLWALALLATVGGAILFSEATRKRSPGPLSAVHGALEELAGRSNCSACHGGFFQTMADACAECHAEILEDVESRRGVHGTARVEFDVLECGKCHLEHHGEEFSPTRRITFQRAGIPDPESYDHALLGFELGGRHLELSCGECHENASVEVLPEGCSRYRGLDQDCASCHEDVHEGRIVRECASCHGQEHSFAEVYEFEHEDFADEGAHAEVSCGECHPPDSERSVEILAGANPPNLDLQCGDCHESPHRKAFLRRVVGLLDLTQEASCAECHDAVHGRFHGHPEAMRRELHAASGFPLQAPHDGVECRQCHRDPHAEGGVDFLGAHPERDPRACEVCHEDPHTEQFAKPFAGRACVTCHQESGFSPPCFDVEAHADTAFPLEGGHAAVGCNECHRPDDDGLRVFHGTPAACVECHSDAHRGRLVGRSEDVARCEECHATTRFSDVDRSSFDHAAHTSFPLEGAHTELECEACHVPGRPDELGRSFGFVHEVFGEPVDRCSTCHHDVHRGMFDEVGVPEVLEGRRGCARCHSPFDFEELVQPFDHALWTGFDTGGAHAQLDCKDCHVPEVQSDGRRVFGRVLGNSCVDCHGDPHVGQFVQDGVTDCHRCHGSTGVAVFDHQTDSRFPLDEQHVDLECGKCHVPWPLPGGGTAIRYKPLGTECGDCHSTRELGGEGGRR